MCNRRLCYSSGTPEHLFAERMFDSSALLPASNLQKAAKNRYRIVTKIYHKCT